MELIIHSPNSATVKSMPRVCPPSRKVVSKSQILSPVMLTSKKFNTPDFGHAVIFKPGEKINRFGGTLYYIAPEIVQRIPYNYKADIWSLGILYYELIYNKPPFYSENDTEVLDMILYADVYFNRYFSNRTRINIMKMLESNPKHRADLFDILEFR